MLFKSTYIELPRRVTAYCFLFGVAGISWLAVGILFVSASIHSSLSESSYLTQLGRISSAVSLEQQRHGNKNLQSVVERIQSGSSLVYCAVVSQDGRYVAHSSPDLVGQQASELTGAAARWADVERIRFVDADSKVRREYRTPLKRDDKVVGSVRIAVAEPSVWSTVSAAAEVAPLTILGPMAFMAVGALVLQRLVQPFSNIEGELRRAAVANSMAGLELSEVPVNGPASVGWNRMIDHLNQGNGTTGLEARLSEIVPTVRQKKMDVVLNSLSDGIAITDPDGAITFANHALAAMLDIPDDENVNGKTVPECLDSAYSLPADNPLLQPEFQQRTVTEEIEHTDAASRCILRIMRRPIRSHASEPDAGHVWCVRDVTQQKMAEEMRNQFVDTATHELRTPLANIKAYAETLVLSEMNDVEQQKDFLNTINSEATRLARFVDDLLSVSSMEVGSLTLTRQETDVRRMFNDAITKVRPQLDAKKIEFDMSLPEKMPPMSLDKDKIAASLVNLLGNAAKYTASGGAVSLRVSVTKENLMIDVADSGIGISQEELPKIFDKFFRSNDPQVQQQTGTGLGLSLVYEIVRLHGGTMIAESELEKGTTISVTLPLV